jgi:hypothetical protein
VPKSSLWRVGEGLFIAILQTPPIINYNYFGIGNNSYFAGLNSVIRKAALSAANINVPQYKYRAPDAICPVQRF